MNSVLHTYIVSYDLRGAGKNYKALIDFLKSFPAWCHLHGSTWLVQSPLDAVPLGEEIMKRIDGDDSYSVFPVGPAYSLRASTTSVEWVKRVMG